MMIYSRFFPLDLIQTWFKMISRNYSQPSTELDSMKPTEDLLSISIKSWVNSKSAFHFKKVFMLKVTLKNG
jgi:hypothetical protein